MIERLMGHTRVSEGGCWEWTAYVDADGYGRMSVDGEPGRLAHRVSYEAFVGPIPPGLEVDHLCRNRCCIRPEHLEPVTKVENCYRGMSFAAVNYRKTHCDHGHKFTDENTYVIRGRRQCRACNRAAVAQYRARKTAA